MDNNMGWYYRLDLRYKDSTFFTKKYFPADFSKILAFMESLRGVTSRNEFKSFVKEKAGKFSLPEVVATIETKQDLEQSKSKSSCIIL